MRTLVGATVVPCGVFFFFFLRFNFVVVVFVVFGCYDVNRQGRKNARKAPVWLFVYMIMMVEFLFSFSLCVLCVLVLCSRRRWVAWLKKSKRGTPLRSVWRQCWYAAHSTLHTFRIYFKCWGGTEPKRIALALCLLQLSILGLTISQSTSLASQYLNLDSVESWMYIPINIFSSHSWAGHNTRCSIPHLEQFLFHSGTQLRQKSVHSDWFMILTLQAYVHYYW